MKRGTSYSSGRLYSKYQDKRVNDWCGQVASTDFDEHYKGSRLFEQQRSNVLVRKSFDRKHCLSSVFDTIPEVDESVTEVVGEQKRICDKYEIVSNDHASILENEDVVKQKRRLKVSFSIPQTY